MTKVKIKSERISDYRRDGVVGYLMRDNVFDEQYDKAYQIIKDVIGKEVEKVIPQKVKDAMNDPELKDYFSTIYLNFKYGEKWEEYIYDVVKIPQGPLSHNLKELVGVEIFEGFKRDLLKYVQEMKECNKKKSAFKNKLNCTLSNIPTTAVLEKEFPEAYEAYIKLYHADKEEEEVKNSCDAIEEVRAMISTFKKEEK